MINRSLLPFFCFLMLVSYSHAFNLRKISSDMKGSIINSVFQDKRGLIWIGTNVGAGTYDGKMAIWLDNFKGVTAIDGTITGDIFIESLYGLKIFEEKSDSTFTFRMFSDIDFSTSDEKGTIFVIQGNGSIYYKTNTQDGFDNIIIPDLLSANIKGFFAHGNMLQIITDNGRLRTFEISYNDQIIYLGEKSPIKITTNTILYCFEMDNGIYMVDNQYKLSKFNLLTKECSLISDLKPILSDKGKITAGIVFKNEFYFGTETGLFVIRNNEAFKIPINRGVTCLLKDRFQDLIWIGTSGDGIYTYSYDPYAIKSNLYSDFAASVSKPVSAVCHDNEGGLWLGTQGDGIIILPDYDIDREIADAHLLSDIKGLPDNTVHSFYRSEQGIWIGCESGLAFYSYKDKVVNKIDNTLFKNIRAICVQDSTLWLACYEQGVIRAKIAYSGNSLKVRDSKLYSINSGDNISNRFSAIYVDGNNILFINSGNGLFKLTDSGLAILESASSRFNSINSIFSVSKGNYIASTDFGTVKFRIDNQNIIEETPLNNISTKDIIKGGGDDYWFSTDNGLILYNPILGTSRYIDRSYGLTVFEFCNRASFRNEQNGMLFFGGINGFTAIKYNYYDESMDYMPTLFPERLSLFGIDRNINDFRKNESDKLILKSNENFFSITFNALDYINGNNYTYYYKIGENGKWIDNGNSGIVSFTDVKPGNYKLYIKYYNKMLNKDSYTQNLLITVLPPWYRSIYAYSFYIILTLFSLYIAYSQYSKRKEKRKKETATMIEQQRKEEIYEAKLDFFTDIAHEFCTPLTLISGPCNLIMEQNNISLSVTKYASIINHNAKRMNSLISDLMDFKQMESGYKIPEISTLNVSEITDRVTDAFKINIAGAKINIVKQYPADIIWKSDEKFLTTILINLISNAIKYSDDESIKIEITTNEENLTIAVSNRGKGIDREDISRIFNRFSVLDNGKKQTKWKQTGLGLTITASMVKLLSGNINVESAPGAITIFTVNLPLFQIEKTKTINKYDIVETIVPEFTLPYTKYEYKDDHFTVAIIDDNPEMLWLICDVLSNEFNVLPINDSSIAIEVLSTNQTDIILCDVMMEAIDGIELTKTIKSDKGTSHIPLIIISAAHDIEIQTKAISAGAELYITKPFDNEYLKTTIRRLLGRKEDLKDYFSSPLSAYELNMGKLQHSEHRKFLRKIHGLISKNIDNEKLSPDFIASELGMSTRSLYRKLKDITDIGLQEMIRDGKLAVAENLLLRSKLTIDEVVFKSRFSNRASFYRAFSRKYGCTPTEFINRNKI